jgi:outer membrane receptor protein involved in Fe transport
VFGGNINLDPETAKTWTLGVVFQPEFLPRFSMSLDYYNIRVKDVIGTQLPGDAINACFGNITADSANRTRLARLSLVTRSPAVSTAIRRPPGPVPPDDQPG